MKTLWILYLIAGAPVQLGPEWFTKEDCNKAMQLALEETFGTGPDVHFKCVPWLASESEGQP